MSNPYSIIFDWQDALQEEHQPFAHVCFDGALGILQAQCQGESQSGNSHTGGALALLLANRILVNNLEELIPAHWRDPEQTGTWLYYLPGHKLGAPS